MMMKQGILRKLLGTISEKQIWHPTRKREQDVGGSADQESEFLDVTDRRALLLCQPDSSC